MNVRGPPFLIALSLVLAATTACTPVGACGPNGECASNQVCEPTSRLCLNNEPPRVVIELPSPDDKLPLTDATVSLVGNVRDEAGGGTAAVEVRIAGGEWRPPDAFNDEGVFSAQLPLPPTDHAPVLIEVRARDTSGYETIGSVAPIVDNVAPEVVIEPAHGDVLAGTVASVRFSELITLEASKASVEIQPSVPGSWNASPADAGRATEVRYHPLDHGTEYRITVAAAGVRDAAGNVNTAETVHHFRTAAAAPPNGRITGTGGLPTFIDGFDVASDGRGNVAIAAWVDSDATSTSNLYIGRIHPQTGGFELIDLAYGVDQVGGRPNFRLTAGAWSKLPGRTTPIIGASWVRDGVHESLVKEGARAAFVLPGPALVIPYSSTCFETDSADPGLLLRSDATWDVWRGDDLLLQATVIPTLFAGASADDWELLHHSGSTVTRYQRRCSCSTACTTDVTSVIDTANAGSTVSAAVAQNGARLYLFDEGSARVEYCSPAGSASLVRNGSDPGTFATSGGAGGRFIGARKDAGVGVRVLVKEVTTNCANATWQPLGVEATSANATAWRPALFGNKPGVVYSAGGELFTYVP